MCVAISLIRTFPSELVLRLNYLPITILPISKHFVFGFKIGCVVSISRMLKKYCAQDPLSWLLPLRLEDKISVPLLPTAPLA